jgi:hypothetical protein
MRKGREYPPTRGLLITGNDKVDRRAVFLHGAAMRCDKFRNAHLKIESYQWLRILVEFPLCSTKSSESVAPEGVTC